MRASYDGSWYTNHGEPLIRDSRASHRPGHRLVAGPHAALAHVVGTYADGSRLEGAARAEPRASATRVRRSTGRSDCSRRRRTTPCGSPTTWQTLDRVTVRADLTRSKRTRTGLDEEVFSDIGEQVSLRQFDIADCTRTQGTLIITMMPTALFSISAWAGGGQDDRPDAQLGLTDSSFSTYAIGVDGAARQGRVRRKVRLRSLRLAAEVVAGQPAAEPAVHRPDTRRLVD